MKYYTMEHRGGFEESKKTMKEISYDTFINMICKYHYKFYSEDKRLNGSRYIIDNMEKNINLPTWLIRVEEGRKIK